MTLKQACDICDDVQDMFNINLTERQIETWVKMLMERGDYEKTMRNTKNRASDGNKFRPSLSEIIITSTNVNNTVVKDVDETETHAYKKRHDENYAKVMNDMEKLRNRLISEVQDDE